MSTDEMHTILHQDTVEKLGQIESRISKLEGKMMSAAVLSSLAFTVLSAWLVK